jgi:hypothetical protein
MNEVLQKKLARSVKAREKSRKRRAYLKSLGLCLTAASHGPATHGVLCKKCREIHTLSH